MIFHAIIFLVFSYITFKTYTTPATILGWFFVGIGLFIYLISDQTGLLFISYMMYMATLTLTALVTEGDFY